jgi:DNA-binding transcriptional MocR family regulator
MADTLPDGGRVKPVTELIAAPGAAGIAERIEAAVRSGALAPGQPLPPIRALARSVGVDANTVAAAYRAARDRGLVETAGRAGTRVRSRPTTMPRRAIGGPVPPGVLDLSTGDPDPALLPDLVLPDLSALPRGYDQVHRTLVDGVARALRERGAAALAADGVPAAPLAVTGGALDAIERALQVSVRPRARVAVEDPGWADLLDLLPAMNLELIPVSVDDEGPLPDAVAAALGAGVEAVVMTPRAQNPTGACLSPARASALREVLTVAPDVLVVEDDHGAGLASAPLCTLGGATRRWAHVRSLSKAYGPDLRVAVVAGDETTVARVAGRQRLGTGWVSVLLQQTAAATWAAGEDAAARAGAVYDTRRAALLAALAARGVPASGRSGLNAWVPVRDETAALAALLRAGYAAAPGSRFRVSSASGVRITTARLPPDQVEPLAAALAVAAVARR